MKRHILRYTVLLLGLFLLSGCGRSEPTSTVELWTDQPLMALYTELYNSSQDGAKVKLVYRADVAEAFLTEGGKPDVVIGRGLANRNLAPYMQELSGLVNEGVAELYPDLLELGRYQGAVRFLPLSFDIPAIQFLQTSLPEEGAPHISVEELRARGEAFNEMESERYLRMGFSPLWDARFLLAWAQIEGTEFTEIEELSVAWDQAALEQLIEAGIAWRREVNGGSERASAFADRYLYDPVEKLLRRERIGFYYTTASEFLSEPDRTTGGMSIRWLGKEGSTPVLPEIKYAAIPDRAKNRRKAVSFLRWLLDPEVQQEVMEISMDRQLDSFGFLDGLSSLPEVNREIIPRLYPFLLGRIPPAERLIFPAQTPLNWREVEEVVVGPWIRRTIGLRSSEPPREPGTDLGKAIDLWYRARGL